MGCGSAKEYDAGKKPAGSASDKQQPSGAAKGAVKADEKLLDKYILGKVLGQGAFGVVYSCKKKGSREEYAVKMIDQVETPLAEIRHEAEMLRSLEHPCIVKLKDVYYEKVFVCMVLELYRGGDMIEGMQLHWKNKGMLSIPVVQNISKMMVQSVEWLHVKLVIHRDLKGDNFLMDKKAIESPTCRIFLSDFGTVVKVEQAQRLKHKCGTKTYWAPEFYDLNYNLPVDMWAIGVIMFGLVTGRFPFKGEDDCKNKTVKLPSRTTPDGEAFILGTLKRDEGQRLKADAALKHPFLSAIKSAAEAKVAEQKAAEKDKAEDNKEQIGVAGIDKESAANIGIQERRRELVERLAENAATGNQKKGPVTDFKQVMGKFVVNDQFAERTTTFEWWTKDKVTAQKLYDASSENNKIKDVESMIANDFSEEGIVQTLKDNNIDTSAYGQGEAKSTKDLVKEVQSGTAVFMLDATQHKHVVRVVDVVLVRICFGVGASKKFLVKSAEKYPDGRERADVFQISGTKKLPHESARQTIARIVDDRLKLVDGQIEFEWSQGESFEEDENSPSYPGLRTVYRKQIYEGIVGTADAAVLERVGLKTAAGAGPGGYQATCSKKYQRTFQWLTEAQCTEKKVIMRAPAKSEMSPIVHPPIGFEEEELQKFLTTSGIDIATCFGPQGEGKPAFRTLKELSEELIKGESQLIRNANNKIVRLVDVVILLVTNDKGEVLVEASETLADGKAKPTQRLPAVKRRPDENPFWAAKRVLSKVLKISENLVNIKPDQCFLIEEEKDAPGYPAFKSKYRRLFIPAPMVDAPGSTGRQASIK